MFPTKLFYPRWSVALNESPGADFQNATVEMTQGNSSVDLEQLPVSNGFGDNTLVWEPNGLSFGPAMNDQKITVTVKNIIINDVPTTYTYDVTIIDPDNPINEEDTIPPAISNCPTDIVQANDIGQCSAEVFWTPPTTSDNVGVTSFISTHNSGDLFFVGTTAVSYTAKDAAGNSAMCNFDVVVADIEAPIISDCPSDFTYVHTDSSSDPEVFWAEPGVTDNCQLEETIYTKEPGDLFPFGISEIAYRVTDKSGNIASCSFEVRVDFDLPLMPGWNLVSLPVKWNFTAENLFGETVIGNIWSWRNQQYESVTVLEPYEGYWVYATDDANVRISGQQQESFEDDQPFLTPGWNLFGPIAVVEEPYSSGVNGLIWYWEESTYKDVITGDGILEMGSGYWIKSDIEQLYP